VQVSGILLVDATVHYLSEEHLPFAIIAILILLFILLPPFLLIFYPCKIFNRCLNSCHKRRWHALHTFVETFHGCYKNRFTEGKDFRSMSGIYMFIRILVVIFHYHVGGQQGWLLHALIFLTLFILTLILQPYKKSYMSVLDALLLALMGLLMLLVISFQFVLPS